MNSVRTIYFDYTPSLLLYERGISALRAAYLTMDEVAFVGNHDYLLFLPEVLPGMNWREAINAAERCLHQEDKSIFRGARLTLKIYEQIKAKRQYLHDAEKNLNKVVNILRGAAVRSIDYELKQLGLQDLKDLAEEGVLTFPKLHLSNPEWPGLKASEFLTEIMTGTGDLIDILLLPEEFIHHYNLYPDKKEPHKPVEAMGMRMQCYFSLPSTEGMSPAELRIVRRRLRRSTAMFTRIIPSLKVSLGLETTTLKERSLQEMQEHAATIQAMISGDDILKTQAEADKHKRRVDIMIGIVPVQAVLNFYRHFETIKESTRQAIAGLLSAGEDLAKRELVVMAVCAG